MTFTIELTPEESRRVEAAQAQGVDVPTLFRGLLHTLPEPNALTPEQKEAQRVATIRAAAGSMAHFGGGMVEELHRERQADLKRDEREYEAMQ